MSSGQSRFPNFKPVGVARDYSELQPLLREIADTCGLSRNEIDRRGGLPDSYSSKALAPVPIGTTDNPSARMIAKLLAGVGAVLIVARDTEALARVADEAVKRREEHVRARLLDPKVMDAAKSRLARENGKKGAKALRAAQIDKAKQARKRRRAARIRWRGVPKAERRRIARAAIEARWARVRLEAANAMLGLPG